MSTPRFAISRLADIPPTPCPCGQARRAFMDDPDQIASIHLVDLKEDPTPHYHKTHSEIYYILEGSGIIELDGEEHPVSAGDAILIKPYCRHRAKGDLKLINVPIPTFDPADEWFD
jgi:mannose-6-phosphate isomerase-like protein (cupin superfamily)